MKKRSLPIDFDPELYLELNHDVRDAGVDPEEHYLKFGLKENRIFKAIAGIPSDLDFALHANPKTKRPLFAKHETIWDWIKDNGGKPGLRVLEIGSRSVQSDEVWKSAIPDCDYTGLDILDGKNVNIIGDAHQLSELFSYDAFDLIICFAVFEHLALPWIVVEEISKVLAPGGMVVIETHFSFSEHELPWLFFQFNANALEVMFCPELGFEIIDSGLDTPIVGRFSQSAAPYLRGSIVKDLYCHSSIIARKSYESSDSNTKPYFDWRKILARLGRESMYPLDSDLALRQKTNK